MEFDELFVGGKVSVIHGSTERSSRGPSLRIKSFSINYNEI